MTKCVVVLVLISKLFLLVLFVNLQYGSNFFFVLLFSSVEDADSGEIPVAFVIRKHGSSLSQEAVMDYVARRVCFVFCFEFYFKFLLAMLSLFWKLVYIFIHITKPALQHPYRFWQI